jgi:hypothetical protein
MAAIIMDFGKHQHDLNLLRINGSKEEIYEAIDDMKNLGCEIWGTPIALEKAHKHWSVLIKVKIPEVEESERGLKK